MGGVESLCLGEAGAAAMGERTGGLENRWQRGTGARDRPSLTPVMPDRCLCLHCKVAQCSVLLWAWLTVVSARVNVGGA